mgnify:CR=1 FL=1
MRYLIIFCFLSQIALGQEDQKHRLSQEGGKLELGLRSTLSAFGNHGFISTGVGGQFRLKFSHRLNSEWFADYITTNLDGLGKRTDAHIGWAVMGYFLNYNPLPGTFMPYFMGGHCFDYTRIEKNIDGIDRLMYQAPKERWSSAVHTGIGSHYFFTERFNLSLSAQYMIHLGNKLEAQIIEDPLVSNQPYLFIKEGKAGLEGHLFLTLSANLLVADLWSKASKK